MYLGLYPLVGMAGTWPSHLVSLPVNPLCPLRDKAGGYGLQARGGMLVEAVLGDALNVIGFPLNRFCRELPALLGPEDPKPQNTQEDSKPLQDPTGDAATHSEPWDPFTGYPAKLVDLMEGFKASKVIYPLCSKSCCDLANVMTVGDIIMVGDVTIMDGIKSDIIPTVAPSSWMASPESPSGLIGFVVSPWWVTSSVFL